MPAQCWPRPYFTSVNTLLLKRIRLWQPQVCPFAPSKARFSAKNVGLIDINQRLPDFVNPVKPAMPEYREFGTAPAPLSVLVQPLLGVRKMNVNKMFLAVGVAALMGAAAPANATWGCWFGKKCGGSSSSSGGSSSGGGSSGGSFSGGSTPTPVPEPEQMALFGMGAAALGARVFVARRKKK